MSEDNTRSELARTDHLFYVTLKYTRTADVIKSIIKRLINALDSAVADFFERQKVKVAFGTSVMKVNLLRKNYGRRKNIKEIADLYMLLIKIDKAPFKVREEYRKHVAIETDLGVIDIEKIKELFEKTKEYVAYLYSI